MLHIFLQITSVLCIISMVSGVSLAEHRIPQLDGRVIGGVEVQIEEFPYQVSLQQFGAHFCGAAIISESFLLTAAHCTEGTTENDLQVRVGSSFHASEGVVVRVKKINQHEAYDPDTMENDISVLELMDSLKFSPEIQPVPLADHDPLEGDTVTVSGWGRTTMGSPSRLQAVSVNVVNQEECIDAYKDINSIAENMFCAAAPSKDACQGDSGGPLVGNGVLIGVISWGYGCAQPAYPGVYVSVASMRAFIKEFV